MTRMRGITGYACYAIPLSKPILYSKKPKAIERRKKRVTATRKVGKPKALRLRKKRARKVQHRRRSLRQML